MAREQKTLSNDGATPNPWNWWAQTTISNTQLVLDAWRAGADSVRTMMRLQQDEILRIFGAEIEASREQTRAAEAAAEDVERSGETVAPIFMQPMIEATRAYGQVGKAFIVAQRDTMRAFAQQAEKPH